MTEQPDDFIVGPRFPLTGAQAEAFRAGVMAGLQKGAGRERAAIVAWLRECAQRYADMYGQPVDSLPAHMYAGWIERGEHVKGTMDRTRRACKGNGRFFTRFRNMQRRLRR